jgi:hypothetical protein
VDHPLLPSAEVLEEVIRPDEVAYLAAGIACQVGVAYQVASRTDDVASLPEDLAFRLASPAEAGVEIASLLLEPVASRVDERPFRVVAGFASLQRLVDGEVPLVVESSLDRGEVETDACLLVGVVVESAAVRVASSPLEEGSCPSLLLNVAFLLPDPSLLQPCLR